MTPEVNPASAPELSIVVLCYRSGDFVNTFVANLEEHLKEFIESYEIVLVGNYDRDSDDDTPAHVRKLAESNPNVVCVCKQKEGMMGWDMRSGLEMATGRLIAVIDGDGQMPISDIARVYELMIESGCDLGKTFRTTRGDGLKRIVLSYGFNVITTVLFPGIRARDINSKPKIIRRSSLEKMVLASDDWFVDAEIMIEARRLKLKLGEIPTDFAGLVGRRSFVRLSAVIEFFCNLIRYRIKEFSR
jgi:glycosyltransferase involved in cell wall biosynthesis